SVLLPSPVVERSKGVALAVDWTADDGEIGFRIPVGGKDGGVLVVTLLGALSALLKPFMEMGLLTIRPLKQVKSVHPYGAFVQMPGAVVQGLVHRTQVSSVSVSDVSEVLQPGERVWCKVINITGCTDLKLVYCTQGDDNKLALSMKVVDQGNGMDLDPNGVQIEQDERRRKAHPSGTGRRIIELGAVLNTTCSKCGVHGHLANECFRSPDGKTYSLVEEEKDDMPTLVSEPPQEVKHKKKMKKHHKKKDVKKKDKHSKKKKRRHSSSSCSSNSSKVSSYIR
ncbi:unnamed protein product, partial [Timema podura]|nr:unnamed protein product [Timema podura]